MKLQILQTIAIMLILECTISRCLNSIQELALSRPSDSLDSVDKADTANTTYKYIIKKFRVPVDHFSFSLNDTFEIRYLINSTWQEGRENPPIFFYTGNEGRIEVFAENTGFMWEIASLYSALIVFAEHRYYGESLPYGNKSYADVKSSGYLTSQQALADYADLLNFLKTDPKLKSSPVISFGGSYGGMLSAWMRMKYPHIIQGAIAASAPILQFTGITDCNAFYRIVTSDFKRANPICSQEIRKSWTAINNVSSTEDGKKWLFNEWKLCKPISNETASSDLKNWLIDVYSNLAMVNYPYESQFLAPLPAHPIREFCKHLKNVTESDKETLLALKEAINVYTNYTGKTSCISIGDAAPDLGAFGWNYQACTEMVMPFCTDGINDMFEPRSWNFTAYSDECYWQYGVRPVENLVCDTYGCLDLTSASNIVFSNGLLDPWSSGGVLKNVSPSAVALIIPEGAHHLDLRAKNPSDPASVTKARKFHKYYISKWIDKHYDTLKKNPSPINL